MRYINNNIELLNHLRLQHPFINIINCKILHEQQNHSVQEWHAFISSYKKKLENKILDNLMTQTLPFCRHYILPFAIKMHDMTQYYANSLLFTIFNEMIGFWLELWLVRGDERSNLLKIGVLCSISTKIRYLREISLSVPSFLR